MKRIKELKKEANKNIYNIINKDINKDMNRNIVQRIAYDQSHVTLQDLKTMLKNRKAVLETLIGQKRESMKNAPPETLRVSRCRNKNQYYYYNKAEGGRGVYISQNQREYVCRLAQKSYDEKVLHAAEKESRLLQKMILYYKGETADSIYNSLSESRKELVEPIEKDPEEYAREWSSFRYEGKGFAADAAEFYTDRGERVRSKSEWIIANILCKNEVPYRYECPFDLKGYGTVYPDFTVLNTARRKEILWEHLGMMDDPVYAQQALRKIQSYMTNGIYPGDDLILTAETRQQPLNIKIVQGLIDRYCFS